MTISSLLAILVLFGCSLLDPASVFIGITCVRVLPEDFLLQFSHGIKAGVGWILCCSSVDAGMHVIQTRILNLTKQISNLGLLICDIIGTSTDGGMSTVHFTFEFGPPHVWFVFSRVVQVLERGFCLDCLLGVHATTNAMVAESKPF